MPKVNAPVTTFNAGRVSPLALARIDHAKLRFAAEQQTNFIPRTLGPMMLRPGWRYIDTTKNNAYTWPLPFIFAHDDTAILEFVGAALRVRIDDALVTRPSVSTVIQNGTFGASAGWVLTASSGASANIIDDTLQFNVTTLGGLASAEQPVVVSLADIGIEHAIRIVVDRGPVRFRIGSSSGAEDILATTSLGVGEHSLAFTPTGGLVYVQFESGERRSIYVASAVIEAAGTMELTIPYTDGAKPLIRHEQSGDVVFLACEGYRQYKIERRAAHSWSFVYYLPPDGPFRFATVPDISITPSATSGVISLTASAPLFRESMELGLFRLFSSAQVRIAALAAADTYTDPIRLTGVSGVENQGGNSSGLVFLSPGFGVVGGTIIGASTRTFTVQVVGTFVGTVTLQRSFTGPDTGFEDVTLQSYPAPVGPFVFIDEFDNAIVWYRLGFKAGDYTSGSATAILSYAGGGGAGIVRILDVTSPTVAVAEVLKELSSATPTKDWQEGEWNTRLGFPTAVRIFEGRLWWFGKDRIWASVSDAYETFDPDFQGDAGPLQRSIGYGPIERINWALALPRLILGLEGSEASIRSSALDQPITPTNFAIKDASTQGSATVEAVKVDSRGVFLQNSKRRVYQLLYSFEDNDYRSTDLTALLPDVDSNIVRLVVQRQPDTRIHAVKADGSVMILVYEPSEEVMCWVDIETDGAVENVVVLPGEAEDQIYYYVRRTIDGNTVRYLEKWAQESECIGGTLNKQADAFILYSGAATTTITGLDHLEGEDVVVWAGAKDLGSYTVTGGQITGLSTAVTSAVVGLTYRARFKSAKLAYGAQFGTALSQKKRINMVGLILRNTHAQGVQFGQNFTTMDNLPLMYQGAEIDATTTYEEFDEPMIQVPGDWDTDARLCLEANAPKPCMVLGAVIGMTTNDKS